MAGGSITPIVTEDFFPQTQHSKATILSWLETEFAPLTLAAPDASIYQYIDNAVLYWNTHSAYKWMETFTYANQARIQLNANFKSVVQVYPTTQSTWIYNNHPLWTLTGITVLDNLTSDLIIMSEAFKNYRYYIGTDFRWTFQKSEHYESEGGYLYVQRAPTGTDAITVVGTKRITSIDKITSEYQIDWIQRYVKSLLKLQEGNTLRKSGLVNIKNDGQELVNEGQEEKRELEEQLKKDGRWVVFVRKM